MKKMTQLETCRKALESASKALECIKANDKTVYNYKGDGAKNRDGLILEEGRWATPREIAEDELKLIQAALSAQGEQGMPKEKFSDAKRLDWLEKNGVRLLIAKIPTSEGPVAHVLSAEGWGHALWQVDFDQKCSHGDTLREAIDEAISKCRMNAEPALPPTAQKPPTETQARCPKCKTEVEWVVPPIPGVKPFFQCQDQDCNWISDDDFPVTESKEGRGE